MLNLSSEDWPITNTELKLQHPPGRKGSIIIILRGEGKETKLRQRKVKAQFL